MVRKKLRKNVLLVVDDAYAEYMKNGDYKSGLDLFRNKENVFILRTFSKIFGLKNNVKNDNNTTNEDQNIANVNNNLEDKEKDTLQSLSNQSIEEIKSESELDMIDDYNHYDDEMESQRNKEDDLLQIPAFLRRQAN